MLFTEMQPEEAQSEKVRGRSLLEWSTREGESPVYDLGLLFLAMRLRGVELLENAALIGWYTSSKAKYGQETDSEQVP